MTVYLIFGLVGLAVIVVSLVAGDLLEGAFDSLGGDWFSTEVVGSFVSALGFAGATSMSLGLPDAVSLVVGLVVGALFGWFGWLLTRMVRGGNTDATPEADDVIGRDAVVVSAIPADGYGTIRAAVGGHTLRFSARADLPLESGTEVHVTSVLSPTAVTVAPTWSSGSEPTPPTGSSS